MTNPATVRTAGWPDGRMVTDRPFVTAALAARHDEEIT